MLHTQRGDAHYICSLTTSLDIDFTETLLVISPGPPEPPSNPPEIMDVTKSTVALSWARPRDDGGSRVTGYFVDRREVSTEKWVRHNKTHITTTMYNVTGLIPDAEYMFRVVAQNDIGKSEPGPISESVVCKDPFGEFNSRCYQREKEITEDSVQTSRTA